MFKFATETEGDEMKVMAIAPYTGLKELMISLGEQEDFELQVEIGDLEEGLSLAKKACDQGVDVIISRGGTAELIERKVSIPVVEIEVSGYDMLRVLTLVKGYPGKTAIVGFSPISEGAATICEILDIDISSFKITEEDEIQPILVNLQQKGYENIIGDASTTKKAEGLGLNGILLTSGKESVLKSFQQAKRSYRFLSSLHKKYLISHQLLQEEQEAIVVYDINGAALFSNPSFSEKIGNEFENHFNIKEAIRYALTQGTFKTMLQMNGSLWNITENKLRNESSELFVFRITKGLLDERQANGISVISPSTEYITKNSLGGIATKSNVMKEAIANAEMCANTDVSVWISGEEGTGKSRLARYIHFNSGRRQYPLVVIDCNVVDADQWEELLSTESPQHFFSNHVHGSIFLKNVEHFPLSLQKKLAFYLNNEAQACRFLSSSQQDPKHLLEIEELYPPLYYALAGTILSLPSLRDRAEDIESLTLLLIGELNIKLGKQIVGIRPQAVEELKRLKWNGNLNELKRFIQESMVLAKGPFLECEDVKRATVIKERAEVSANIDLNGTLEEIERKIIQKVWREEGMNQTKTAQRLGINRTTLWRKLK